MSDKAYKDTKYMNFNELFPKGCLRTIPPDLRGSRGAAGEISIVMELLRESSLKEEMPKVFKGAMYILGFVKKNLALDHIFEHLENRKKPTIVFHECDDKVLVIFSAEGNFKEKSYYMTIEEFKTFFAEGLHPNLD